MVGTIANRDADAVASQQLHLLHGQHDVLQRSVDILRDGCSGFRWTDVDCDSMKLTMALRSAPGADWVGSGISDNGGMKGSLTLR